MKAESLMDVLVVEASLEQKPALHRLMQLYLYDSTEFTGDDASPDGVFTYRYFDEYWREPDRDFPFLIYCGANLAGFVLVNSYTVVAGTMGGKVDSRVLCHAQISETGRPADGPPSTLLTDSRGYGKSARIAITLPVRSSGGLSSRNTPGESTRRKS